MGIITREELKKMVDWKGYAGHSYPHLAVHIPRVLEALEELIKRGQETHEPLDWMSLGTDGNVTKAIAHITKTNQKVPTIGDHDDHWLNACCRMLMAFELRAIANSLPHEHKKS